MAGARKFSFDTEFAPDGAILKESRFRLAPEEVEAERKRHYEHGKTDGLVAAERESAAALQALADAASAILTRLDAESRAMREEAARIAMATARKVSGAALDAYGHETVAAAIEAALDTLRAQPRLVVRLSTEAAVKLKPRIEEMSAAHAYAGAVLVREEPGMRSGAVSIDWSDGIVSLDPEEAAARIEELVNAALASAAVKE